jgi:uncharacterized membrane protein YczE
LAFRVAFVTRIGNPPLRYRLPRRLTQLYLGLTCYGAGMAFMVRSRLGNMPWDVFHQGLARHVRLSLGTLVVAVGAVVLLLWIPLRQRPGIGTVSNLFVIGLAVDGTLALLPTPHPMATRIGFLVLGILLNGLASGLYIGAALGPGPRDGLMTGLAARTGRSIRLVRTLLEVAVVLAGWLLGGTLGVGTVAYALTIGPLVHASLPRLAVRSAATDGRRHRRIARRVEGLS